MPSNDAQFSEATRARILVIGGALSLMWIIVLIDYMLPNKRSLSNYGIKPRTAEGLIGIFFSPFLHSGIKHIAANTVPFGLMATIISLRSLRILWITFSAIAGIGGLGVWFIGRPNTNHIGASGVVFGFFSWIVLYAWFERPIKFVHILLSLATAFVYFGILWGVLPSDDHTSYEGHACGLVAGIIVAAAFVAWNKRRPSNEGFESVATLESQPATELQPVTSQPISRQPHLSMASQAPPSHTQTGQAIPVSIAGSNPFDPSRPRAPSVLPPGHVPMTVPPAPPNDATRQWQI